MEKTFAGLVLVLGLITSQVSGAVLVDFISADEFNFQQPTAMGYDGFGLFRITFELTAVNNDAYLKNIIPATAAPFFQGGERKIFTETYRFLTAQNYNPQDNPNDPEWLYSIPEGISRRFTVVSMLEPTQDGVYRMGLEKLEVVEAPLFIGQSLELDPVKFKTDYVFLRGVPEPTTVLLISAAALIAAGRRKMVH